MLISFQLVPIPTHQGESVTKTISSTTQARRRKESLSGEGIYAAAAEAASSQK